MIGTGNQVRPLISVVTAVLNNASTIQRCIDSVSGQSYRNVEHIIMDGGSSDGTVDILRQNTASITYWESKEDRGIYHAWNKALEHAGGEWMLFLGADDFLWSEDSLEKLVPHLAGQQNDHRVVYCKVSMLDVEGNLLEVVGEPWKKIKKRFLQVMGIPNPATFYHRSMFDIHGKFDESFRIAGDYEFLLRELKSADALSVQGLIMTGMYHGGVSSYPENSFAVLKEIRTARIKNGFTAPGIYWIISYVKAGLRSVLWRLLGKRKAARVLDCGRHCTGKKPFWTRI